MRGGGDLATGTIYKLWKSGLKVLILECQYPSAIRRKVAFSDAVYNGSQTVEDVTCHLVQNLEEAEQAVFGWLCSVDGRSGRGCDPHMQTGGCCGCNLGKKESGNKERYGADDDRTWSGI